MTIHDNHTPTGDSPPAEPGGPLVTVAQLRDQTRVVLDEREAQARETRERELRDARDTAAAQAALTLQNMTGLQTHTALSDPAVWDGHAGHPDDDAGQPPPVATVWLGHNVWLLHGLADGAPHLSVLRPCGCGRYLTDPVPTDIEGLAAALHRASGWGPQPCTNPDHTHRAHRQAAA